ncbi:hypothetical protein PWR63_21605 [Paraburkholderia sp. A2WS-5]|uniref:hypothetical protein n=1 Tax=unclassified Paraburkholderia TaxID=2615204 RepID=UPI003B7F70A1
MEIRGGSLRAQVEKWLGPISTSRARVTQFSRSRYKTWRYVRVESVCTSSVYEIVFFRHDDGAWRVFPPENRLPAIGQYGIQRT